MSITATERTEILKLLVLMFNAAPGELYLNQVVNLYETLGKNLAQLADSLDDIPAYQHLNPNFQTAEEFATAFLTPLGLQDDALARSFIIDKFNNGESKGQIVYDALQAIEGIGSGAATQYQAAFAVLANKTAVAEYFSVTKGISQTDINFLQLVLNGITADPASVAAAEAEIDAGTRGTSGLIAILTPSQDTVVGTPSSDQIEGLFGASAAGDNTYTAGDSVDGGAGIDRLNLVALGSVASQAIIVKNVEAINIQDTVGATFNALLVENTPGISFTNTLAGLTSKVTNAALGSVMGLSGKGNLTVDYLSTTGSTDTANVALNGAGTSTSARSTVNVADGNTVEKINIATSGTNFVTLTGGTVASMVTITGSGTNNFGLSAADSLAAVATIDASASTGTNTFAMGGNLNTGTTIKGGTGADTASTTLATPTLVSPAMTGVETLGTTFTAGAVVDLSTAVGLQAVTASASTANMTFQNALASVTSVTVSSLTTVDSALKFGYDPTNKGDITLKVGSTSATATAVDLGLVTLSNTKSVTVSTLGALDHDIDNINIAGHQTSLTVNTAADSSLGWGTLTVKGDVDAYGSTQGAGSSFSGYTSIVGDLGASTITLSHDATRFEHVTADTIADVTINATGNSIVMQEMLVAPTIGNLSVTALGDDGHIGAALLSSGGTGMGDLNFSVTGDDNGSQLFAIAFGASGADAGSDIGEVTVAVNGDGSSFSGYAAAFRGDVAGISLTVQGSDASARLGEIAIAAYTAPAQAGATAIPEYAYGGNVGDISLTVDGRDAHGAVYAAAYGGNAGDITVSVDGQGAGGGVHVFAFTAPYSGSTYGDIGNVSVSVGDDAHFSGYYTSFGGNLGDITIDVGQDTHLVQTYAVEDGEIGTTTLTADDGAWALLRFIRPSGGLPRFPIPMSTDVSEALAPIYSGGTGTVGDITATFQNDGHLIVDVSGSYDFGNITATFGNDSSFSGSWTIGFGSSSGFFSGVTSSTALPDNLTVGDINVSFGDDGHFSLRTQNYTHVDFGDITAQFGDGGNFDFHEVRQSDGSVGNISATFGDDGGFRFSVASGGSSDLTLGNFDLAFGANASAGIYIHPFSGGAGYTSVGHVHLTGGDSSSTANVDFGVSGLTVGVMGGVDASAWLGSINVDLASVQLGTTVRVGAEGSWVRGTEGADNIFLGAGRDTVTFDYTSTATDVIFSFTAGAGKDVLDLPVDPGSSTNLKAVMTADAAATAVTSDVYRLADIAGGQDITTVAGLLTALQTGEYASLDVTTGAHFTIITAASTTASAIYVFDVSDNSANGAYDAGEIVLIGVVNTTAAGALGGLVISNFQTGP